MNYSLQDPQSGDEEDDDDEDSEDDEFKVKEDSEFGEDSESDVSEKMMPFHADVTFGVVALRECT